MEVPNFHRRHHHFKRLFSRRPHRRAHQLHVSQHFDQRLIKPEILDRACNPPIFNKKQAVTRHAGHHFFVRVHFADIPQPRHQQSAVRGSHHFLDRRLPSAEHQIHRRFSVFVGQRKTVSGRLPACGLGRRPRIDQIFGNSAIHDQHSLPWHPFSVKRRTLLQGMKNVINNADVLSKKLLPHPVIQAGAFVLDGGRGEVVKKEPHQIEYRRRLQNHRVAPRRQLLGFDREMRLLAGALGELLRMKFPHVCGIRFGPACCRVFLHGYRKLGMRFAVSREQALRIAHRGLADSAGENPRRHLPFLGCEIASKPNRARPILRSYRCRRLDEPAHLPIALLPRHRQQLRVSRLAMRQ